MTIKQKLIISLICWVIGMWILIDINYWLAISACLIMQSISLSNNIKLKVTADRVLTNIRALNEKR